MNLWQVLLLSLVQGLTEFLPISSSGHLVLTQNLLGVKGPTLTLDVFLHLGTLLAVVVFLKNELKRIVLGSFQPENQAARRRLFLLIVASLPAGLAGFFFQENLTAAFSGFLTISLGFLMTSLLLVSTHWIKNPTPIRQVEDLTLSKAFLIGIFQAAAILPGLSRSGATLAAGLWLGLAPAQAFSFSFLLSIPAILGANLLQINFLPSFPHPEIFLLGVLVAGLSGFLALKALQKIVASKNFYLFAFYTLFLAFVSLILHIR